MRKRLLATLAAAGALACAAEPRWWMDEPVRLVQTNLRETDANLDAARLVQQVADLGANALLFGMGGIRAYYPTKVPFHYPSPFLPPGRDLFGEVLREAHKRGIRVIGRFVLSKSQKEAFDAHPEWFFKRANGEPAEYNGTYATCINGGYYREHALKILAEALERYEVDGLFFNMFGNPGSDYSGRPMGTCRCDGCKKRFEARYGRPLPEKPDADYREFMEISRNEVAASIAALIRSKRPRAAFLTYIQEHVDGIMSESNTAVDRPLPLWPYSASDNVNRARNSEPDKMAFNLCMAFVDIPYRFAHVPPAEIRARLFQNMANGAGPSFAMLGTPDQEDRRALPVLRSVNEWHKKHEELYVGQQSAARVLLLSMDARQADYRGFFRILSEQHIPFAVSTNLAALDRGPWDIVIAPDGAPAALEKWVRAGGRLLVAGAREPAIQGLPKPVRRWNNTRSAYFRIRDHSLLPSLKDTDVMFLDGEYLETEGTSPLTLIPPARFGPPERVWTDKVETQKPGLLMTELGAGKVAWIPWQVGALYYRHSSAPHAALVADLIDRLLPAGRQLVTNAHPLVEITLMRQPARARTLVHFVNLTGHSQTGWFDPIPMRGIRVEVSGKFKSARVAGTGEKLKLSAANGRMAFLLPKLDAYEVVVLE